MSKIILFLSVLLLAASCSGEIEKAKLIGNTGIYLKKEAGEYPGHQNVKERTLSKGKVFRYTEPEVLDQPDSQIETLVLNYNAIACTCAQWSDSGSDNKENSDRKTYYWLEPADEKLIDADRLFTGSNLPVKIKVAGQVISEKGFPGNKNLSKVNENEAGKVFGYTKIERKNRREVFKSFLII